MKKTLCACMAAVLALASLPVLGASAEETTYALGDVDMDGVVTGHDTAMVSRYVLDDTYSLTEEQLKLADVNEDGVVDQADADKLYHEMQVYQLGDADMDGRAAMMDAENIIIYSAKIAAGLETDWTPVQMNLADANLDGTVDNYDACYILYGYVREAAGQNAIYNEENASQYYYAPVKIVVVDKNAPNYMDDLVDGKYSETDTVYVPKTNN